MLDPTHDETDFLRRLYERGGRLALHGNMGLFKIDRLFPDYVTRQSAGKDTVHFTLTEKGTQAGRAGTQGEAVITGQQNSSGARHPRLGPPRPRQESYRHNLYG